MINLELKPAFKIHIHFCGRDNQNSFNAALDMEEMKR